MNKTLVQIPLFMIFKIQKISHKETLIKSFDKLRKNGKLFDFVRGQLFESWT